MKAPTKVYAPSDMMTETALTAWVVRGVIVRHGITPTYIRPGGKPLYSEEQFLEIQRLAREDVSTRSRPPAGQKS